VFSRPEIKQLFQQYIVVQLYTDRIPTEFYSPELQSTFGSSVDRQSDDALFGNQAFIRDAFDTIELPLYVILEPREDKIDIIGVYRTGVIRNVPAFAQFLRNPGGKSIQERSR
jgi:hypothetical protein